MPLSATQSRMRARSSSSRRKRRRTGSRSARSSTSEAVRRRLARSSSCGDDAEHRVGLAQRAVGEADAQVGRAQLVRERLELVVLVDHLAGAERGLDERRERLDVRAHHDHVARLQRVVLLEQVEDRVAQDLDLARAAVAGVDLDAAVARIERRPGVGAARERDAGRGAVGAHVGLDAAEQRVLGELDRVVVIDVLVGAEHELHLARVLAPGGEQPVVGAATAVGSSARRTTGGRSPIFSHSAGEGCRRKRWTSRPAASARSTSRWPAGRRVRPKSEMRSGRSSSAGSARSRSHAGSSRSAGLGVPAARAGAATAPPAMRPRSERRPRRAPSRTPSPGGAARSGRTARRGGGRSRSGARAGRRRPRRRGAGRGCAATARPGTRRRRRAAATRRAAAATGRCRARSPTRPRRRRRRAGAGTGTRRSRRCRRSGRASRRGSPTSAASASAPSRGWGRR